MSRIAWSGAGSNRRPSAFQAGHNPSWCGLCERPVLSPVAAVSRWSLLLLSPLLLAAADLYPCGGGHRSGRSRAQICTRVRSGVAGFWVIMN